MLGFIPSLEPAKLHLCEKFRIHDNSLQAKQVQKKKSDSSRTLLIKFIQPHHDGSLASSHLSSNIFHTLSFAM